MSSQYENFGKYVLLEKLATGGMAEVFLARGSGAGGIGKFFAIKRILPQYADSPEFIDMFKDEAKIAINLNHSNIVSIHEFGVEKGQFFLVMDYVEGRNLRQILNKMKKTALQFSMDQIVYVIKEVAAGLDHAHRCIDGTTGKPLNITHRDMSPQNVMVSFEGEVKIVDFGIAKAESQLETTRAGTLKGKFGYMSPEQAEGQQVDLRTDIFSLGIVLWELLANDRLFVANNEINTLRKIRDCQIPSLRKINPNLHTELERIVQKALARDRNLRYQTGAALHRDLSRFLNRQYPDFSPHDFSVFIKSVFSDEILSLRKRLVEYAKVNLVINLNIPSKKDVDGTATSLLDNNTDSILLTASDASGSIESKISTPNSSDDSLVNAPNSADEEDPTIASQSQIALPDMTGTIPTDAVSFPDQTMPSYPSVPAPPAATVIVPNGKLLDDSALAAEAKRDINIVPTIQPIDTKPGEPLKTEEISPAVKRSVIRSSPPRSSIEDRFSPSNERRRQPVRLATLAISAVLCLSVYSYLVKYFPDMMAPVVTMTNPFLGFLHDALGVTNNPVARTGTAYPLAQHETSSDSTISINSQSNLIVTSNPSGAEIWINETNTGMVTPTQLRINNLQMFNLTLRKKGYADFRRVNATREQLGHRLDANLQKLNVALLDVEIFPPQEAVLTVNGKQVHISRSSAHEIQIPGNTSVKVRAETPNGNSFEEVTINVPADRRKTIQLNPRKMPNRGPSNSLKE